jgi:hypothetical protein
MKMFWSLQRKIVLIAVLTSMVSTIIVGGWAVFSFYSEQVELQKKELQSVQESWVLVLKWSSLSSGKSSNLQSGKVGLE